MPVFMVRTIKLHIWKLRAPVQPSRHQPSGSRRSKPYYGNYVQLKCNRPDARATPSTEIGVVGKLTKNVVNWWLVWTAINIVRKVPVRTETLSVWMTLQNFPKFLFGHENSSPSGRTCQRLRFWPVLGHLKHINKRLESCIRHRIW
jgi:hypothetical protein